MKGSIGQRPFYGISRDGCDFLLSRRDLLKGVVLVLPFLLTDSTKAWAAEPASDDLKSIGAFDRTASSFEGFAAGGFIRIGSDGRNILVMPSAEMGQGIYTAEAMLIAEELEIGLDQLEVVAAPPSDGVYQQPLFKAQVTGGSTSIRGFWRPLREAGAAARMMLAAAAAKRWNANPADCSCDRARVIHRPTGRSLSYTELVEAARKLPMPGNVPLKPSDAFKLIGRPAKRVDTADKVNGKAVYGIDVEVPGMKVAAVAICPVDGGRLRSVDASMARKVPGVIDVVSIGTAVAVVGEHFWAAKTGVEALEIDWDLGPGKDISSKTIRDELVAVSKHGHPITGIERGEVEEAFAEAATKVEAIYELPFLAHATLEPINTTVHVRPDGCDIWVGTQVPTVAQKHAARITGLPIEKIVVHNHLIGGGFGRRLQVDTIDQAVAIASQVTYPLKVIWTREQDIQHDRFRPSYYDQIAAGLDQAGMPVAWTHRVTSGSVRQYFDEGGWPQGQLDKDSVEGARDTPYDLTAMRVDWVRQDPPVKLNWWRGVGPTHNVFVVESFIDELAHAAKWDPIDYRCALLGKNSRSLAVLNIAAKMANWGSPLPPRSGRGVSLHDSFGTHAAMVVEASVDPAGEITLQRVFAAVDCGIAINPDTIRAQIEGGGLFGLSAALFNEVTFSEGQVEQSNFHDYRQLRINEAPTIEVHVISSDADPGGIGEVGTVSAAPALANALFAATGVRLRRLPFDRSALANKGKT